VATFIHRFDLPDLHGAGQAGEVRRLAVKDLIDMAGVVTTNGSKVVAAEAGPAEADAACMSGTRAAEVKGDVVVVGKTNLHELAFGVTGINPWYGTPVNPLDPSRVPGGSSSGSAVALAGGEADLAFGSDTGGSVRMPAACCGIVGLKTTRGRVSLDGVRPLAPSLDTVGPMGATVGACEEAMALLEPGFDSFRAAATRVIGRVRLPAEGWVDRAIDDALAAWAAGAGAGAAGAGSRGAGSGAGRGGRGGAGRGGAGGRCGTAGLGRRHRRGDDHPGGRGLGGAPGPLAGPRR
jgi:amidase